MGGGIHGVKQLAPISDMVVVVDVLSFTTCVDVAVGNGACVFPYRWRDGNAAAYAERHHAELAGHRGDHTSRYSLSPASLQTVEAGTRIVLPSPNGSTLSLSTEGKPTYAACMRNAEAVASAINNAAGTVAVIAAGERWQADRSLRPAVEDLLGAGAIIHALQGSCSPEAVAARGAFREHSNGLADAIRNSGSGRELIDLGYADDVEEAAEYGCSDAVPLLTDYAYVQAT